MEEFREHCTHTVYFCLLEETNHPIKDDEKIHCDELREYT